MTSIATLGIKVTTEGVAQASSDLDKLGRSGNTAAAGAQKVAPAFDKAAVSAKQLSAATRQLPAQFTDIFTGLASGQAPLQVLIQQGGQLKDTFGGVGPALRASAGYIAGLINPITLVAAAVAGLGLAWKQQQDRLDEFNISLAKTNNFIGLTAQQLVDLTEKIDRNSIATAGNVTEAVNRVVAGGRIAQEQLEGVSKSAAEVSAITGESIDSIVKKYEALSRDPVDTLLKLNESERFLTKEQLNRVRALEAEGRAQDAATEAIKIYMDNSDRMVTQVRANLGEIARGWIEVKNAASSAWQEVGVFADKMAGATRRMRDENVRLIQELRQNAGSLGSFRDAAAGLYRNFTSVGILTSIDRAGRSPQADFSGVSARVLGGSQVVDSAAERAQQQAREKFQQDELRYLDDSAKKKRDIAEVENLLTKQVISREEATKRLQQIEASYAARAAKGGGRKGSSPTDYSASILAQLRQQIALNEEQARSEENLSASQRLRVRILEQLDALGGKVTASQRAQIKAELEALESSDARAQAMQAEKRLKEDLLRLNNQLAASEANRARANQADLMAIGRGGDAVERARRALDIEREYEDGLRALRDRGIAEDSDSYRQQEAALRASRDRMLDMERDYYAQRDAMQADWKNGAVRAFEDYMAEANDVAGRTAEAIDGVLNSLQGTFEEFFRTGKLDWKGFLDDINAELARFFSQQLVKQILNMGSQNGSEGGWAADLMSLFGSSDQYTGFSKGGYTGPGGKNKPAGIVHAGEYVLNQDAVRGLPMGYLDHLNRGGSPAISAGGGDLYQSITVQGRLDRRSVDQLAAESMRRQNLSRRRTG